MSLTGVGAKLALKEMKAFAKRLASPPDLDAAITAHVLEELPRLARRLEEGFRDIEASGCSLQEAQILVVQTLDAQRRTMDPEKRARLADVLVNGFGVEEWSRIKHGLLVRMAFELEPEHIEILRSKVSGQPLDATVPNDVRMALENELTARGLLQLVAGGTSADIEHDVDMFTGARRVTVATALGRTFLETIAADF